MLVQGIVDDKFSILGIVKNARVLSHRCDITYAGTASNLPPEIYVDSCVVQLLIAPSPCTWDRGKTRILTFPSAKIRYMPFTNGTFKHRTPGSVLRPSTRAQECLYFGGLKAWHILSTADIKKSPYMPLLSQVPLRPWLHYSNTDWIYPKLVSRLNCFRCHSNRNFFLIICIDLF